MDALALADLTAEPLQVVGYSFYFDPVTRARAKELGLRGVEYYGLGRGGVLGDVDASRVAEVFVFFSDAAVATFWSAPRERADPVVVAAEYLESAYGFADRTFGGVDVDVLRAFGDAARAVAEAVAPGTCPLVDGYLRFDAPEDPVHAAYLGAILLRELRGGLHARAVAEVGLEPRGAAFLQDPDIFTMHGYVDADAPEVTETLRALKARAEDLTNAAVASCFAVLDDAGRAVIAEGTRALSAALADPVAVAE